MGEQLNITNVKNQLLEYYTEIPVSIDEFLENPRYLGSTLNCGKALYPRWREHLRNIWKDPYKYNEIVFTGAIGIGKSTVAVCCAAYGLYMLMCLKDPHKFFNIGATQSNIIFLFFNTTMTKAQKSLLGNLYGHLLKSPWFMERGHEAGDRYKTYVPNTNVSFEVGSEEQHATSLDIYMFLFDEANDFLHKNADFNQTDAMKILNAANQRIRSRFKSADRKTFFGKSIIMSSKQSELAFLEQYVADRQQKNPDGIYIVDEPQWNILPLDLSGKTFNVAYGNKNSKSRILTDSESIEDVKQQGFKILVVPIEYKHDFDDNLNRALTEMGGVSVSYIDKYFSREYVAASFDNSRLNPFSTDILIVGLRNKDVEYKDFFDVKRIPVEYTQEEIYMHIDTSKTKDRTGITAVSQSANDSEEIHHLFTVFIQAPKDDQICFAKHENFIFWLYDTLNWNIKNVSSDGYNSDQIKQNLIMHGIAADYVTADGPKNKCYPTLQRQLYDKHLQLVYLPLLEKELVELDINNDKQSFDHPITGSKDGSDSLCCAVQNLINHRDTEEQTKNEHLEEDLVRSFQEKQRLSSLLSVTQQMPAVSQPVIPNPIVQQSQVQQSSEDIVDMEYFRF